MRLHPVDLPGEEPTVLGLGQLAGLGLATLPAAQDGNHFFQRISVIFSSSPAAAFRPGAMAGDCSASLRRYFAAW